MLSIWAGLKLCCLLKLKGLKPLLVYIDNYMYLEIIFLGCLQICPLQEVFVSYGVLFFSYDSAHSAYQPCLQDKKRKIVIFQIVKVTVAAKTKENKYLMHFELLKELHCLWLSADLCISFYLASMVLSNVSHLYLRLCHPLKTDPQTRLTLSHTSSDFYMSAVCKSFENTEGKGEITP